MCDTRLRNRSALSLQISEMFAFGAPSVMGVYPMLLDETCFFLAVDLDGEARMDEGRDRVVGVQFVAPDLDDESKPWALTPSRRQARESVPGPLSMNRKGRAGSPLPAALPRLPESEPHKAGAQRSARPTNCTGSGSQCVSKFWKTRLSMNRVEPRRARRTRRNTDPLAFVIFVAFVVDPRVVQGPNASPNFGKPGSP